MLFVGYKAQCLFKFNFIRFLFAKHQVFIVPKLNPNMSPSLFIVLYQICPLFNAPLVKFITPCLIHSILFFYIMLYTLIHYIAFCIGPRIYFFHNYCSDRLQEIGQKKLQMHLNIQLFISFLIYRHKRRMH
jgi:hypothetical protein